jgi:hypothetical protein
MYESDPEALVDRLLGRYGAADYRCPCFRCQALKAQALAEGVDIEFGQTVE